MKRSGLIAFVTVAAGCSPATNLLPVNDFNRPTDVAFMCFGAFPQGTPDGGAADAGGTGELKVSGRPLRACHPQNEYDPGAAATTRTFAFLPNSAAGTLSAVDADHWKLVDLNVDTGGYGTVPLGQLPEQISASDDGCQLISANRGSCDLTLVDPSILVASTFNANFGNVDLTTDPLRGASQNFRPIKGDGTLLTAPPYEAVFLPQDTGSLVTETSTSLPIQTAQPPVCGPSAAVDPVGWSPQPSPKSWYALVTYPSCDLITVVALPSGQIVSAAYVRAVDKDGKVTDKSDEKVGVTLVDAGTSPVCSSTSCAGQALAPSAGVTSDAAPRSDAAGTVDALGPVQAEAGVSDGPASATDAGGGASGTAGTTGSGGAPGTGGASGAAGASGSPDAGSTGGSHGGMFPLGNQYPNDPYFGPGELGPSGIAIIPDGSRAYVSLANASFVVSVGLTSSGLTLPGNGIYLNEGARGSSRVRLNVDPNRSFNLPQASGTDAVVRGVFVGANNDPTGDRQFLYAIARDGTLRVVWVFHPGAEIECETNADPQNLPPGASPATACIPVDPLGRYRRPFSVGPGIHFPSLPTDVASADIQTNPPDQGEQSVNGAHAWVITDSGIVYLVNLNPVLRQFNWSVSTTASPYAFSLVTETPPFVNTLRDRNEISYSLTLDPSSGPPRVDVLPSVPVVGPYIEPFWTQGSILNATAVSAAYLQTVAFFPQEPPSPSNMNDPIDRRAIIAQTWTVAWEGALSGVRNSGHPLASELGLTNFPGGGSGALKTDSLFQDGGANYCALGVVTGDLVTLTGCTDNTQCGLGEECVFGDSVSSAAAGLAITGICVDPNRASAQTSLCTEFLNSVRRYEIESASPTNLIIRPHLDEIVLSSLTPPCHPAVSATDSPDSCPDTVNDLTSANFKCVSSYPGTVAGPRCLMPCKLSSECRAGRLCVDFDAAKTVSPFCARTADGGVDDSCACTGPNCFCADAPPFDHTGKACFDQLVNYQVNAGKTFLVAGSQAGFVTTAALPGSPGNPGPTCLAPSASDPGFGFRIPINGPTPTCSNVPSDLATIDSRLDPDALTGDALTLAVNGGKTLVNFVTSAPSPADPCLYIGGPATGDRLTDPTKPCTAADGGVGGDGGVPDCQTHVRALFRNSQMSFVLANVDRAPSSQFVTSFDVHGGFGAQVVQDPITVEVSMPARIVLGPVDSLAQVTTGTATPPYEVPYVFVVDQHRLGREQGGGPTRGQLLRINPLGYAVTVGSAKTGYQPIFEDYNASGALFPIQ